MPLQKNPRGVITLVFFTPMRKTFPRPVILYKTRINHGDLPFELF